MNTLRKITEHFVIVILLCRRPDPKTTCRWEKPLVKEVLLKERLKLSISLYFFLHDSQGQSKDITVGKRQHYCFGKRRPGM